jgi:hypothetical protein
MEDSYDTTTHGSETPFPDYPINADGRTTMTGHQFRVNSAGNITIGANPAASAGYRIWVTFADNCAGIRPGVGTTVENPGGFTGAVTDTNVYYAYSDDGGLTWAGGDVNNACSAGLAGSGRKIAHFDRFAMSDQWFPWSDTDSAGNLHVGFMDADVADGPVRRQYGFSNTTVTLADVVSSTLVVSSAPSDPDRSIFFRRQCPDEASVTCASFIGDYNGLAVDSNNDVHSIWTDMRRAVGTTGLNTQDAFYSRQPTPPGP